MIKIDKGYYSSEKVFFTDHHANHVEEGFVKCFLIFINESEFQCTNWKNKETLSKDDISLIQRGGEYKIENDRITLIYRPTGEWREECTIVDEDTLLHHFSEPAKKLTFKAW